MNKTGEKKSMSFNLKCFKICMTIQNQYQTLCLSYAQQFDELDL